MQWVFVAAREHSKKKCEIQIRQFSATFGICINKFIDSPAILYKIEQENFGKEQNEFRFLYTLNNYVLCILQENQSNLFLSSYMIQYPRYVGNLRQFLIALPFEPLCTLVIYTAQDQKQKSEHLSQFIQYRSVENGIERKQGIEKEEMLLGLFIVVPK